MRVRTATIDVIHRSITYIKGKVNVCVAADMDKHTSTYLPSSKGRPGMVTKTSSLSWTGSSDDL